MPLLQRGNVRMGEKGRGRALSKERNKSKRGRPRSRSAPAVIMNLPVIKKRKQWTELSMNMAVDSVKKGGTTITRAALEHGVPRTTLQDRISGRVLNGCRPGRKPYLSKLEERDLSKFLVEVADIGYGKSRQEIKLLATYAAKDKGILTDDSHELSDGWYYRFMSRQEHLSLRKGDQIANVRMDCLNREVMNSYFELLKKTLSENNLLDSPDRIYNVDETGMPLDHRPPKVVTKRGQKKVRTRTSGNKAQITVIACVSAAGQAIPPFVIFDAKGLNHEWTKGEIVGTMYGLSDSGWVDRDLFKGWLTQHFLKYAVGGGHCY